MIKYKEIPIIEAVPEKRGYWEIYKENGKITSKIWHDESDWHRKMRFKDYEKVNEKYDLGSDWMNLETGENKVRIVSEFEDYGTHYDQKNNKSVICVGKENCEFCQKGDKPRVQFLGWVIDRKDGKVKLLRIGHSIFKQIGALAKFGEYAFEDMPDYDMTIVKKGEGLDTEYSVVPARQNTPLTDEEQKMIEEKVKSPREVIDNMKAKVQSKETEETPGEEMDAKDIPL